MRGWWVLSDHQSRRADRLICIRRGPTWNGSSQYQQLGVLGRITPGQHYQAAEQATHELVRNREDHPAMISDLAGRRGEIE
jgi:hypothetical protein